MQAFPSPFGIRGFLIHAPEYGSLRSRRDGALVVENDRSAEMDLAALFPDGKQERRFDDLSTENVLALCIYRGGPQTNLETYVRGKCVYRVPEPTTRA
jgi:hypothetical protein